MALPSSWRPLRALLALGLLVLGGCRGPSSSGPIHLVILHTNDVHGQALPRRGSGEELVGGLVRLGAYVDRVRTEESGARTGVVLVDGGDWFQGTPEGRVHGGQDFVRLLAGIGYDAMALGNHEFDLGLPALLELLRATDPPVVCANLREPEGNEGLGARVDWLPPYRIVERCGLRIALVGLITPTTIDITHRDARRFEFADPGAELERVLAELEGRIDLVVPVTHAGLAEDRALARRHPDLPLIVGGHSHHFLDADTFEGETRIVQAGAKAAVVGRVDLTIDSRSKRVLESRARLVPLDREPDPDATDPGLVEAIEALRRGSEASMGTLVGTLAAAPRPADERGSGGIGNWICDVLRASAGADVALHNRGGIRSGLRAGPVTRRDLFEVCPFGNTVATFELSGAELLVCLRRALDGKPKVRIDVSGLAIELDLDLERTAAGPLRLAAVTVAGMPLDPARIYRVATNSFLAGGGEALFRLDRPLEVQDHGLVLVELLEQSFASGETLHLPEEDRIRVR